SVPLRSFAEGHHADPVVLLRTARRDSRSRLPAVIGKPDTFKPPSFLVAPQRNSRSSRMRKPPIPPAVFVEVECDNPNRAGQTFFLQVDSVERLEFPFAGIQPDG